MARIFTHFVCWQTTKYYAWKSCSAANFFYRFTLKFIWQNTSSKMMTLLLKKKKDKIGGITLPGMWWFVSHCHLNNVKWLWEKSKDQRNRRECPEIDSQIEGKLSHDSKDITSPWEKNRIFNKCFCDNCPSKWETQLHPYIMAYPPTELQLSFHLAK